MWRAIACGWLIADKRGMKKIHFFFFFRVPEKGSQGKSFIIFTWPTGRPCLQKKESLLLFFSTFILSPPPRFPENNGKNIFFLSFLRFFVWEKARRVFLLFLYTCYVAGKKCVSRFRLLLGTSHTWEFANSVFLPFLSNIFSRVPLPLPFLPLSGSTVVSPSEKK